MTTDCECVTGRRGCLCCLCVMSAVSNQSAFTQDGTPTNQKAMKL